MSELIDAHLTWLRPRVRTGEPDAAEPPTVRNRRTVLQHADRDLPRGLDRASDEEIALWLARYDGWTRHSYDTHLRAYYRWATAKEYLELDPMTELCRPLPGERTPRPCTDEELAIALTAREPYGLAIRFAAYMGLRAGEIARADRSHVTGDRLAVKGKGGRRRTVPIPDDLLPIVLAARGRLLGREITPYVLSTKQSRAWAALGLPGRFTLHAGRHWYATRLLEAGATLREVQELLGHASPATTAGYTQVTDARKAAAVARLPRVRPEPASNRLGPQKAA